jgi:putative Mn2+ efflux pump MntP
MTLNWIGIVSALATFFGVWIGHVLVRAIESRTIDLRRPIVLFALIGIMLEVFSVNAENILLSAAFGILGVTALWDSFEFIRQQKRIIKGHAPANPNNLRHAKILAEHSSATTIDLLKREPKGSQ